MISKEKFDAFVQDMERLGFSVSKEKGKVIIVNDVSPLRTNIAQIEFQKGVAIVYFARYKASWGEVDRYREFKPREYKSVEKLRIYVEHFLKTGRVNF